MTQGEAATRWTAVMGKESGFEIASLRIGSGVLMRNRVAVIVFAAVIASCMSLHAGEARPAPFEVLNAFVFRDSVMTVQRDGSIWQHGADRQWRRVLHDRFWRYADASCNRLWLLDSTGTIWRLDGLETPVRVATTPPGAVAVALAPGVAGVYVQLATESQEVLEFWWYPEDGTEPTGPTLVQLSERDGSGAPSGANGLESMLRNHVLITGAGETLIAMLSFRDLILRCSSTQCAETSWVSPRTNLEEKEDALRARFGDMGRVPQVRVWDLASGPEGSFLALLGITDVDVRDGAISQRDRVAWFSESGELLGTVPLECRGAAVAGHKDGHLLAVLNEKSELDWLELESLDASRSE